MKWNKINLPTPAELKKHRLSIAVSAIILLVLLLVNFLWIEPVVSQKETLESKAKQQEDLIHKYEQKLKQAQSIKDNLTKQEDDLKKMQTKLFRGTDPYQLAASLGDLLAAKTADGQKLDIKTYQVLQNKEYGLYQEVHLRFNLMTTVDGLYYFLDRVKNSQFAILVQEINIQKIQRNKGPDLVVNVILAALMEKGEKS
jgi:DNA repair exonuclease SbcCD ATPase subunit